MKRLFFLILQTLVVASVCLGEKAESEDSSGVRRLEKSAARYGRKVRVPFNFGGFVPSFKMKELKSDFVEPEEDEYDDLEFHNHDEEPEEHSDDFDHEHDSVYHGHHKKKSHAIVHTHVHKGHVVHKHKHNGENKHLHKHQGHAHHEHKHEGHGKHEHKHLGHNQHEHKHKGHAEHGHHHKGFGEHHHHHSGQGKHEHKHSGHAGHKHEHKGKAEHDHKHLGHGEHEHHHLGKGKHEHSHYGHAGHKHEHKGHAEHGHKHSGHGLYEHKHHGSGYHDHKHHGYGHHDHKHHGSGHHSHKHHATAHLQHSHKGKGHVAHKHEGHLKFEDNFKHFFDSSKDEKFTPFAGIDFDGFHSFEHRSDAPGHPEIVFYGNDPDLYNFYMHKKEMIKKSRFQEGEKRIDEESEKSDTGIARSKMSTTRVYNMPNAHHGGYTSTIEHKSYSIPHEEEELAETMNRRQLNIEDDESDVVYGTPSKDFQYIGPTSQPNEPHYVERSPSSEKSQYGEGQSSLSDEPLYVNEQTSGLKRSQYTVRQSASSDEHPYAVSQNAPSKGQQYDDGLTYFSPNVPRYNEGQTLPSKSPQYKPSLSSTGPQYVEPYRGRNEIEHNEPKNQFASDQYYGKDDVYKMHGASYHSSYEPQEKYQDKTEERTISGGEKVYEEDKPRSEFLRNLDKEGFLPEKGDKPHLIQYNVVHTDSKMPSMSYFSQLRAIT